MISSLLDYITTNWGTVALNTLAVFSVIWGVYSHYSNKNKKGLAYTVRTFSLIKNDITKIGSVDILFKGEKIDNLSVCKVALWNSGDVTIDGSDIAKKDPLFLITGSNDTLLGYQLIVEKNRSNGFSVMLDEETFFDVETKEPTPVLRINFDYIDPNDGIVLQLYFTSTETPWVYMKGSIKGIKKIEHIFESNNFIFDLASRLSHSKKRFLFFLIPTFILFIIPLGLILKRYYTSGGSSFQWDIMILYIFNFGVFYYFFFRKRTPKGFEVLDKVL